MNSFNLTLSEKHFICPSILNDSFAGYSNLGCTSLPFITWNTSYQPLLAYKVSFEKSADSLTGTPLQITNFSLGAFKILSLSLTFGILLMSWTRPLCIHLIWVSLCFLDLHVYFVHQIREVFFHFFFQIDLQYLVFSLFLLAPL